jgi:DNA polymerase-3 subunit gamma/tau
MQSRNLETVLDELAEAMHRIALIHAAPDFRDPERDDWDSLVERASQISPEDAQLYYQIAINGRRDLEIAPDPRTGLEMTLLRMLAFRPAEAGSGGTNTQPGTVAGNTGTAKSDPVNVATVSSKKPVAGSSAANAARAAFDAMHEEKFARQSKTPEQTAQAQRQLIDSPTDIEPEQDWSSLQASLDLSGAARELARNLQLESAGQVCWKFLVPDTLQHLGSESVIESLRSALSARLGHAVMLDLHTASEPVESVAAATERTEINRLSEAERAIDEDVTVQEIKEKFGAKVTPDSIQPLQ